MQRLKRTLLAIGVMLFFVSCSGTLALGSIRRNANTLEAELYRYNPDLQSMLQQEYRKLPELGQTTRILFWQLYRSLKRCRDVPVQSQTNMTYNMQQKSSTYDAVFNDVVWTTIRDEWIYNGPGTIPWAGNSTEDLVMATGIFYKWEFLDIPFLAMYAHISVGTEIYNIDTILQGDLDDWDYAAMNIGALINGIDNYRSDPANILKLHVYSRAACIAGTLLAIMLSEDVGDLFISPVVLLGAVADTNLALYEKLGTELYLYLAIAVLEAANPHWVTTEYGSYYAAASSRKEEALDPWDFEIANILTPMIKVLKERDVVEYRDRVDAMFEVLGTYLWDDDTKGYYSNPSREARGLSNNLFCERAHKAKYDLDGDAFDLERIEDIFSFCVNFLYDGNGHIRHRTEDGVPVDAYCVGCQFFFLSELYDWIAGG